MKNPPNGPASDYTDTVAYKILANDPNSRVVVSCKCAAIQTRSCASSSRLLSAVERSLADSSERPLAESRQDSQCF